MSLISKLPGFFRWPLISFCVFGPVVLLIAFGLWLDKQYPLLWPILFVSAFFYGVAMAVGAFLESFWKDDQ